MWSYLNGEWRLGGWWYYYLFALTIKEPVGTWMLLLLALVARLFWRRDAASWQHECSLLATPLTVLLLVSSQTGFSHHLRYVLPALPFLYVAASGVLQHCLREHRALGATAGALVVWTLGSSLWVFPHSMCYYNELVGGPANGHFYLGNSNSDWGQDLLLLRRWYRQHPEARPLYLAYDCIVDPHIAGIQYEEIPEEPIAGWFAISVNLLHSHGGQNEFFLELEPVSRIGYTMHVYRLNWEHANRFRRARGLPEGGPPGDAP